ncbi:MULTISPECIES: DeoR/GlpR family DNA-binding transcription regulator [Pectobacteriaceae]|uniref:DeoR/GlpR transcriptional regulator n=1 Tax=Affinibrenneria salicis TaxID=2590031 RepID=A0A5J5FRG4_9GAMM|nr:MULTISPECIES: DeoR/GlpR family DNA-binding transcription regulator [Pectobacteriaceae]MEE3644436.1 DeoR/GlpR family DNA-binding transcription regulator [Brenneria sp. L3_3C_1]MEE3651998.1 DeoR/GlpR family DNA-binding transcription regulator [Brenneria sp. HEZEL_4_2_4]MEE3663656.1 DeoR/GlpR family DNA-binding transcription regulator [Brenneria sp. g21c3]KAA8995886.1 DeoR/GlpR transcriptional regulator [Affinibrenneria salicis]MBJ7223194.1 DeoR/GlpR transcriptional regulator [Brenneria sp. L3
MTQEERLIELEELIKMQGKVTLDYICQQYNISSDSARRDLVKLAQLPHIMRIRGGAILAEKRVEYPYVKRTQCSPEKALLSAWAAKNINDKDIIFIDAGTTSVALARQLPSSVCVITNSIEVLSEIIGKKGISISILGGGFDDYSHAILGNTTIEQIKRYHADKAFIGVSALSEAGITTDTELDALQKVAMAKQSKKVICITSFSKFNTQLMYQSCTWSDIDHIITDKLPPQNILKLIEANDVELIVVNEKTVDIDKYN